MITHHIFELGSPKLHQMCILGPCRTLLKMVLIDLELQGHLGSKTSKSTKNGLVRAITRRVFELGSPNLYKVCILCPFRTLLRMVLIDLDLHGHLGSKMSKSPQNGFVHAITRRVFEQGSPNLHKMCILCPFRTQLKMVLIDLDLQGHLGSKRSKSAKNGLIRTITPYVFELGSPNLCLGSLQNTIENGVD